MSAQLCYKIWHALEMKFSEWDRSDKVIRNEPKKQISECLAMQALRAWRRGGGVFWSSPIFYTTPPRHSLSLPRLSKRLTAQSISALTDPGGKGGVLEDIALLPLRSPLFLQPSSLLPHTLGKPLGLWPSYNLPSFHVLQAELNWTREPFSHQWDGPLVTQPFPCLPWDYYLESKHRQKERMIPDEKRNNVRCQGERERGKEGRQVCFFFFLSVQTCWSNDPGNMLAKH